MNSLKLRPYQKEAVKRVLNHFHQLHGQKYLHTGKLIHACGTGKTITSLEIVKNYKKTIIFVPNLSLIRQVVKVWRKHLKDYQILAVCSDKTVIDAEEIGEVTSDIKEIRAFMRREKKQRTNQER